MCDFFFEINIKSLFRIWSLWIRLKKPIFKRFNGKPREYNPLRASSMSKVLDFIADWWEIRYFEFYQLAPILRLRNRLVS